MTTTTKAAIVGIQKGDGDINEAPGTITITDDSEGRVYFERDDMYMTIDLRDLMETITTQIGGGNK